MAAALALAAAAGCEVGDGFQSFGQEFFDPAIQYFNVPGSRIAEGTYSELRVQVATDGRRYVAALKDFNQLTLSFFDDTPQCVVGVVADYGNAISPTDEAITDTPGDELLPYVTRDEETGIETLRFANRDCEPQSLAVENASLPMTVLNGAGPTSVRGLLVRTRDQRIVFADPWGGAAYEIGADVAHLMLEETHIFSLEAGEILIRDRKLKEVGRIGNGVSRFELDPSRERIAYAEGPALYQVSVSNLDEPELLEEDACGFRYGLGGSQTRISYLSPCDSGRLVITDTEGERRVEYAEGVTTTPRYAVDGDELRVAYVIGADPGSSDGELWLQVGEDEPELIHESANIGTLTMDEDELFFTIDYDGQQGTYVRWKDGEIDEIAEDVAEIGALGLLANFDGQTGDLLDVDGIDTEVIAEGVPLRARRGDAFIANYDGVVGDLMWLDGGRPPATVVGSGVGKNAFGFGVQFEAIIYLQDRNPMDGTSTLTIRLIETGDVFEISDGVSESREVAYPRPGILYSVLAGDEPGIWFAHAR